jgi:hypothetical protein
LHPATTTMAAPLPHTHMQWPHPPAPHLKCKFFFLSLLSLSNEHTGHPATMTTATLPPCSTQCPATMTSTLISFTLFIY